jgi:hypothetical protein
MLGMMLTLRLFGEATELDVLKLHLQKTVWTSLDAGVSQPQIAT